MLSSFQTRLPNAAAKRDDDFLPKKSRRTSSISSNLPVDAPWRWRRRRILVILLAALLTYLFIHNIPTDLGPASARTNPLFRPLTPPKWKPPAILREEILKQGGPPLPPKDSTWDEKRRQYYEGPILFPNLTSTLQKASLATYGTSQNNENVLYMVSSLRSAANLIPMACDMFTWDKNHVHFALVGREDVDLLELLAMNGVDSECPIYFHDARADFGLWSSDARAEKAVVRAWRALEEELHPQVVIVDDEGKEDGTFAGPLRRACRDAGRTLIEVPADKYEEFLWMTRLDARALANWYSPRVDVLIHAPPNTSGGLLRLLKSLRNANYAGLRVPKLSIELPPNPQPDLYKYVTELPWPPVWERHPRETGALSVRHRIVSSRVTPEQAAVRFLESFYPSDPHSHVLVLSSEAELSPTYFQYLHYSILHHKYSAEASWSAQDLLGLSLEVPSRTLDGKGSFKQPLVSDMTDQEWAKSKTAEPDRPTSFLHQAPSGKAVLIFGDRWASLHDFLTNRFTVWEAKHFPKMKKIISKSQSAWLEYVLELIRCRGWTFLHPSYAFATINDDLAQIPEEFTNSVKKKEAQHKPKDPEPVPDNRHLHNLLPFRGLLPPIPALPYYSYDGSSSPQSSIPKSRDEYIPLFRQQHGGCSTTDAVKRRARASMVSTSDLFCLPGQEIIEEEEEEALPTLVQPLTRKKSTEEIKAEEEQNFRQTLADLLSGAEVEEVEGTDWSAIPP